MTTYAIGDVQGCYQTLMRLLDKVQYTDSDTLWFTGDLVNRGPNSLEVLRFVKTLGKGQITVLGNHDLHALAVVQAHRKASATDTLEALIKSEDSEELFAWLRQQPLLYHDQELNYVMVHAGLPPHWDLETAKTLTQEAEYFLQSPDYKSFLKNMYGNMPDIWNDDLVMFDRLRFIVNALTRMRYCDANGKLDLVFKGPLKNAPSHLTPWFNHPLRLTKDTPIIFGHWASLNGLTNTPNTFALDTGCVWGNELTAMNVETRERFSVKSEQLKQF